MPDRVKRYRTEQLLVAGRNFAHRRHHVRHRDALDRFLRVAIELLQEEARIGVPLAAVVVVKLAHRVGNVVPLYGRRLDRIVAVREADVRGRRQYQSDQRDGHQLPDQLVGFFQQKQQRGQVAADVKNSKKKKTLKFVSGMSNSPRLSRWLRAH